MQGWPNTAPDGFKIPFSAGHTRRMPRLTAGPSATCGTRTSYLDVALRYAHVPVKQAVISPSALSLMYPADEIPGYPREQFIDDLLREHETEVRNCLQKGAHKVQIDFTEGRLAVKIDPSGDLLHSFIDLNNLALVAVLRRGPQAHRRAHLPRRRPRLDPQRGRRLRRAAAQPLRADGREFLHRPRRREGPRPRPGDHPPAHEAGPSGLRRRHLADRPAHRDARRKSGTGSSRRPEYIPVGQLGTTDDCGFSPFCDDTSTTRDTAFAKIRARVRGTALASAILGGG